MDLKFLFVFTLIFSMFALAADKPHEIYTRLKTNWSYFIISKVTKPMDYFRVSYTEKGAHTSCVVASQTLEPNCLQLQSQSSESDPLGVSGVSSSNTEKVKKYFHNKNPNLSNFKILPLGRFGLVEVKEVIPTSARTTDPLQREAINSTGIYQVDSAFTTLTPFLGFGGFSTMTTVCGRFEDCSHLPNFVDVILPTSEEGRPVLDQGHQSAIDSILKAVKAISQRKYVNPIELILNRQGVAPIPIDDSIKMSFNVKAYGRDAVYGSQALVSEDISFVFSAQEAYDKSVRQSKRIESLRLDLTLEVNFKTETITLEMKNHDGTNARAILTAAAQTSLRVSSQGLVTGPNFMIFRITGGDPAWAGKWYKFKGFDKIDAIYVVLPDMISVVNRKE